MDFATEVLGTDETDVKNSGVSDGALKKLVWSSKRELALRRAEGA